MAQAGFNNEKTGGRKSRWTVPLKDSIHKLYSDKLIFFTTVNDLTHLNLLLISTYALVWLRFHGDIRVES